MAEIEGGDSRFLSGFLLGFLAGVLICLGVGGSFLFVTVRRQVAQEREMHERAVQAEAEARRAVEEFARQDLLAEKKTRQAKAGDKKEK